MQWVRATDSEVFNIRSIEVSSRSVQVQIWLHQQFCFCLVTAEAVFFIAIIRIRWNSCWWTVVWHTPNPAHSSKKRGSRRSYIDLRSAYTYGRYGYGACKEDLEIERRWQLLK
jgi:hypothetical protein